MGADQGFCSRPGPDRATSSPHTVTKDAWQRSVGSIVVARSRRSWRSVLKLASGRYQARYLDPDLRHMVPAPGTFASRTTADRWLARKRADLDTGTAVDEPAGSEPLAHWWPGYQRFIRARKQARSS